MRQSLAWGPWLSRLSAWSIRKAFPDPGLAGSKGPSLVPQAHGECRQRSPAHDANPGRIVLPCPCAFCAGWQPVFFIGTSCSSLYAVPNFLLTNPLGLSCNASLLWACHMG